MELKEIKMDIIGSQGEFDDVIIVSGHNLGTAEIESAFVAHEKVAEAAVVGYSS